MSVTVDDCAFQAEALGLKTVGEVLSHVGRENRLVVQLLIDGREPDLSHIDDVRARSLDGCSLFIETAQPIAICRDALDSVDTAIAEADGLRSEAAELLRGGDPTEGLKRLSGCFGLWNHAQDSLGKIGKLIRADLSLVKTSSGAPVAEVMVDFAAQLRPLKEALESRDFVLVCDVLTYDMEQTRSRWSEATEGLRRVLTNA